MERDLHQLILRYINGLSGCRIEDVLKAMTTVSQELDQFSKEGAKSMSQIHVGAPLVHRVSRLNEYEAAEQMLNVGACVVDHIDGATLNDHVLLEISFESSAFQTLCTGRVVSLLPNDRAAIQLRDFYKFEREALESILLKERETWLGWQDGLNSEGISEAT